MSLRIQRWFYMLIALVVLGKTYACDEASLPQEVNASLTEAQCVGSAMFTYVFWDVYEASLFAPNGKYTGKTPFALSLVYQRTLKGKRIAQRSMEEIKKQGPFTDSKGQVWLSQMEALFPDVSKGDVITGVANKAGYSEFYLNGELLGLVNDVEFTERFFGIWLSENTSEPELRSALLNTSIATN